MGIGLEGEIVIKLGMSVGLWGSLPGENLTIQAKHHLKVVLFSTVKEICDNGIVIILSS